MAIFQSRGLTGRRAALTGTALIQAAQVVNAPPVWDQQPAPTPFKQGVLGTYTLVLHDPDAGQSFSVAWAPDSAPRPAWLTLQFIDGQYKLQVDGTQKGAIVNGLKLRATDDMGAFTDSLAFTLTSHGWLDIGTLEFAHGTAASKPMSALFVGFDPNIHEMYFVSGTLSGVTWDAANLEFDYSGFGSIGASATFQLGVRDIVSAEVPGETVGITRFLLNELESSGVRKNEANWRLKLGWRNLNGNESADGNYGDWLDANQTRYGTVAYAETTITDTDTVKKVNWTVTTLVQRWLDNGENRGFYLRGKGTSDNAVFFSSRQNSKPENHPVLTVVTEVGTYTLPVRADSTLLGSSAINGYGEEPYLDVEAPGRAALLQFDLAPVKGATVASATLNMTTVGQNGSVTVQVMEIDAPDWIIGAESGTPQPGLAQAYPFDQGITAHPDVVFAHDFSGTISDNFEGGVTQAYTQPYIDELKMVAFRGEFSPSDTFSSDWSPCAPAAGVSGRRTQETWAREMYCRYMLRLDDDYGSEIDGNKMPGWEGRLGQWKNGAWDPIGGNGGVSGRGRKEVSDQHWAPPIQACDPVANTIQIRWAPKLGVTTRTNPAPGMAVRPIHHPQPAGLVEGQLYYIKTASPLPGPDNVSFWNITLANTPGGATVDITSGLPGDYTNGAERINLLFERPDRPAPWILGWSMRGLGTGRIRDADPYEGLIGPSMYAYHMEQRDYDAYGDGIRWRAPDGRQTVLARGRWYSIEHYIKLNTIDMSPDKIDFFGNGYPNQDGIYRVWLDGILALELTGMRWIRHTDMGLQAFWMNWYHGGTDVPIRKFHYEQTGVVMAKSYIGPMRRDPFESLPKALYVWSSFLTTLSTVSAYATKKNFSTLYIFFHAADRTELLANPGHPAVAVLQALRAKGFKVYALAGEPTWAKQTTIPSHITELININNASDIFDGIHLDVEPHTLPEWTQTGGRAMLMQGLADFAGAVRVAMPVAMKLQMSLNPVNVLEPLGATDFLAQIKPDVDEVSLMSYRDLPADQRTRAQGAIDRCEALALHWRMAVLCNDTTPINTTYFGTPVATFTNYMQELWADIDTDPQCQGLAFENYDSIKTIIGS